LLIFPGVKARGVRGKRERRKQMRERLREREQASERKNGRERHSEWLLKIIGLFCRTQVSFVGLFCQRDL